MTERSHNTGAGEPRVAEGPDVTLIAAALGRWSGLTVTSIDVGPRCPSVMGVRDIVLPSTLRTVGCHGTSMWLDIDERILMVRIGQHTRVSAAIPDPRYAAITIHMSSGASVHISDHRRFVNARVVDPATVRRYVSAAGPNVTSVTRADVQRITRAALSVDRTVAEALADEQIAGADLGADANDAAVVEVAQRLLRAVRDVAGDLLRAQLGVAGVDLVLLDVDRGEDVIGHQALREDDRVLVVVALPRHERHEQVAPQR